MTAYPYGSALTNIAVIVAIQRPYPCDITHSHLDEPLLHLGGNQALFSWVTLFQCL